MRLSNRLGGAASAPRWTALVLGGLFLAAAGCARDHHDDNAYRTRDRNLNRDAASADYREDPWAVRDRNLNHDHPSDEYHGYDRNRDRY